KSPAEGLTVGIAPDNHVYVATNGGTGPANLFVITPTGGFMKHGSSCVPSATQTCGVRIENASADVLGLRWRNVGGQSNQLWVIDNGNRQVLHVDPVNGNVLSVVASGFPAAARLNALTFDSAGSGYVTDHALGRIYKIPSDGTAWTIWSDDRRLKALNQWTLGTCPAPPPPAPPTCVTGTGTLLPSVGANGIEIFPLGCGPGSIAGQCTYALVANTANRNIVKIVINANGTAAGGATLVNGINGPDGI